MRRIPETAVNGTLHEEPGRGVFEGRALKIDHEWGSDFDVQAGGRDGEQPDTWLSEHVLKRFEGKRVRIIIEELDGP
jgi:hypothetical protein